MTHDLNIFNRIAEIAEASKLGELNDEQKSIYALIMQNPVFAEEFISYQALISDLQKLPKRNLVKNILNKYKSIHNNYLLQTKIYISTHKKIIDWLSTAAAILVFAFASYYLIQNTLNKNRSEINSLKGEISAIQKQQNEIIYDHKLPDAKINQSGTAFAISNDGLFATAAHVVRNSDSVYLLLADNEAYKANIVCSDNSKDIAILKIDDSSFKFNHPIPYGIKTSEKSLSSDIFTLSYSKQDKVFAKGYISSLNGAHGDTSQYQLYLPATHGASGSPIIDQQNNIIGFITANSSENTTITYAVKMKYLEELIKNSEIVKNNTLHETNSKAVKQDLKQQINNLNNYIVNVQVY